ncbi:hypothetical protein ERX37_01455 [Macrococcus hajekii]|uniref:Uncharacterized protein n=1 Tax=Macrococcus hajekii TaxID=198482 RepID=A0A4R6BMA6_9STAP|nr:hypothetical protein [Macrococcus hajekii]TDM02782.1 hypothetical protein ERX37_01455 [Macrococcus hajekii]GGB03853.1 hypothetical protein GCM10007190_09840 [Macrococcus hajekii]
MSDIIPFPGLAAGLSRQLEHFVTEQDYESAYETLLELERHAELSERQQLVKLDVLHKLESYLELREEASIMLNQGHPNYEETVYYFLLSLYELTQYQTVIELIDALRNEDINHRLKMKLLPLYDQSRHRKNEREKNASSEIERFLDWPADRQQQFILQLMNEHNLIYASTFAELLKSPLHPVVQTLLIQYIQLTGQHEIVTLHKLEQSISFNIGEVAAIDEQPLLHDVMPIVIDWFDNNMPDVTAAVTSWLKHQAMIIYPLSFHIGIEEIPAQNVAECYIYAALSMFSMEEIYPIEKNETQQHVLGMIHRSVKYEL